MVAVTVVLPSAGARKWQELLVDRLAAAGHPVSVVVEQSAVKRDRVLDGVLALEQLLVGSKAKGLARSIASFERTANRQSCDLQIDFAHRERNGQALPPTVAVFFQGRNDLSGAAAVLSRGDVPVVDLHLNGSPVRHAAPMASSRVFITLGLEDVLARAITLIVNFVDTYDPEETGIPASDSGRARNGHSHMAVALAAGYFFSTLPRLAARMVHRLRHYPGHWRVGYRFIDGPGVVDTGSLTGEPWTVLPDAGDRFYADPFPFEWQGRYFIFVEELVHSLGKGVISVSELGSDGRFGAPRTVLEEPFHLSYPQVFARDGDVWMIPESAGGGKLALYRAQKFPDHWIEQQVLIEDREIFDATLLEHNGLLWLVSSGRDGAGDASDMMLIHFAEHLEGPWRPHPMNPILIDKSAARPGGAFVRMGDQIVLPIQDGTVCYGGGLGLSRLIHLDTARVEWTKPRPIDLDGGWPYPRIHTVNRHGRLETIDGQAEVVKRKAPVARDS